MIIKTGQIAYEAEGVTPPAVTPPPAADTPPAHPVAPWAASEGVWNLGEGETAKPWYDAIPEEDVRAGIAAKGYKNPTELAFAYNSLMKVQRNPGDYVALPPENATPEQLGEFYKKLGRPDSADAYELKFGEGVAVDDKMVGFGKSLAFELGLPPKQAQAMADKWNGFVAEQSAAALEASNQQNEAEMSALATKWGADLETKKAQGLTVLKALGPNAASLVERVEGHIGSAAVVELLAEIGARTAEGKLSGDGGGSPDDPANMTKEAAQAKIDQLRADPEFDKKYNDKNHPEHKSATDLMTLLYSRT